MSAIALLLALVTANVLAHDGRPVFVQIAEQTPGNYHVHSRVPVSVPVFALPEVVMPSGCQLEGPALRGQSGDAHTTRQTHVCNRELSGNELGLHFPSNNPGLSTLVRLTLLNGEVHSRMLKPGQTRWQVPERENFSRIAADYTVLGIEHIFAGLDHLLFVACLVFIARTFRRILITITGFTLAHSLTLFLATLGILNVAIAPTEAVIALSIVFLAHEIVVDRRNSWTWRYPVVVSSLFGLLHGFGFASVLQDVGLPQTELMWGLLFFNLGVEFGQVFFVLGLALLAWLAAGSNRARRDALLESRTTTVPASYVIGTVAAFWMVERLMAFA